MQPEMKLPEPDHEGQMARADLYRAAKHSMKLFQMIQDGQQLEGWVQAKITKAADYLDSIYHYMEYQVKFGQGGQVASVDDITGEADVSKNKPVEEEDDEVDVKEGLTYEQRLHALLEAKVKKVKESDMKAGDTKKTRTGTLTKTKTGVVHKRTDYSDEEHGEPASKVKQKSAAEKKADKAKSVKLPKHKGNTWGMKGGEKFGKK